MPATAENFTAYQGAISNLTTALGAYQEAIDNRVNPQQELNELIAKYEELLAAHSALLAS